MYRLKTGLILLSLGLVIAIGFQNCAPKNDSDAVGTSLSMTYVEMSPSSAQSMMSAYENMCAASLALSSTFPLVASGSAITFSIGNQTARASQVSSVQGTGNVTVYGVASGAKIATISAFTGNATLCGIGVGSITNSSFGNIFVEGGQVDSIAGFSGNLLLLGGSFPSNLSQFTGNIVIKTSGGQYLGRSYQIP